MSALDILDDSANEPLLGDYPDVDRRSCRLLGPTALVVQGLMGILVILSLLYKRHREKPKRPWRIWMFDVSKQVAGQAFVHGVNVLISDVAAHHSSENPCVMYFLNILIDTTLGVAIIYFFLHLLTFVFTEKLHFNGFQSGEYGDPPSLSYWARQAIVYVFTLTTMKLLVVGLFTVWPGIARIGAWLLSWTGGSDAVQVIVVMGLFPIIMNILQFWLIDSIVKSSKKQLLALPDDEPAEDPSDREPLFSAHDSDDEGDREPRPDVHDLENPPRLKSRSRSQSYESRKAPDDDEQKYSSSNTTPSTLTERGLRHVGLAYPPTTSPDISHHSSYTRTQSRPIPAKRQKRSPPPPLQLFTASSSQSPVIAVGSTPLSSLQPSLATPRSNSFVNEKGLRGDLEVEDWGQSWHEAR